MIGDVCEKITTKEIDKEKLEQIERGKRIKKIREELQMSKIDLGKEIGVSGQFIGLIESGKGNLTYKSLKKLINLSEHSADYILYGLDDSVINDTRRLLKIYREDEIIKAMNILKEIAFFINEK